MIRITAHRYSCVTDAAPGAAPDAPHYCLRLFVTGSTPKSARAIRNIVALCEENLAGRHELEVVDIYQHPENISQDHIIVTPTLVRHLPLPVRRIIGDLSDRDRVLFELNIVPRDVSERDGNHAC
jgi:circadian clock protein KaiB